MLWAFRKRKRKLAASWAPPAASGGRQSGAKLATIIVIWATLVTAAAGRQALAGDSSGDSSRLLAVGGQRVELQCPLLGELARGGGGGGERGRLAWRKDGRPLELAALAPRMSANQSAGTLTIVSAQPTLDEGAYECQLGARSHRLQLGLLVAPKLAPFECPAEAQVGMRLVLTCAALEGHQPMSFVWLKDEQLVWAGAAGAAGGPGSLGQLHQQQLADKLAAGGPAGEGAPAPAAGGQPEPGAPAAPSEPRLGLLSDRSLRVRQADDYSILTVERLELAHSGRYTCSVQNRAGRASHSSQLTINAPPSVLVEPAEGDFVAGQTARLDCLASGQPKPTVSWLRAKESKPGHWDYGQVYEGLRYSLLANGSLQIANLSQREQGLYLCSAKNGFGPEASRLARLTVHEPARFELKFATLEVRLEERAELACRASGELPIRIEWLDREGRPVQHSDKRFIIDQGQVESGGGGGGDSGAAQVESRLILARSLLQDSGHYTCRAENKHGADKTVTNLLVLDVPHKVEELKVTNVTSSTISLRWQLAFTGNAPVTSYLVQYQSDDPLDDLLAGQRREQGGLGGALEALKGIQAARSADEAIDRTLVELTLEQSQQHLVVRELAPACLYRLRLAAINKLGLGEFSDWLRARTEEAPPAGAPTKVQAAATGPNSVKLSWSPPERRSWNGQLTGFHIGYRPLDSGYQLNKTLDWSAPSFHSLLLADQQQQQQQQPQSPNSSNSTSSELNGLKQHLRQLLALQQQELVAHLTNLQRSTTYLVWLQAANQRGLGPQSHSISVKTLEDVPPSAPAVRVQGSSSSSITLAWSMLSSFVSPANQYSLFYRRLVAPRGGAQNDSTSPEPPAHQEPFVERTVGGQQLAVHQDQHQHQHQHQQQQQQHYQHFLYTLDQLECGSSYELYMSTRNSVGKSEPSPVVAARTLGEPPQAPASRQALFARIGPTEAALNLAAWSSGGCPFTGLSLRLRQLPGPGAATNATPPAATSLSLAPTLVNALNGLESTGEPGRRELHLLRNLAPSTGYQLELVAQNAAGRTSAHYEFQTANLNGTRSGFSGRKESIFRLGAGGQPGDLPGEQGARPRPLDANHQQLLPLLLMLLCFLCLLLSTTFCYQRLADNWRRPHGAHAAAAADRRPGKLAAQRRGLHCRPGSPLDKSTMWRLNGATNQAPGYQQRDSPTGLHYCLRADGQPEQQQPAAPAAAALPKQGFGQSVSMKDFQLDLIPQQPSQTMNLKSYRGLVDSTQQQPKAGTLRPRLFSEAAANYLATSNQICSVYATTCAKQKEPDDITYANYTSAADSGAHLCAPVAAANHYRPEHLQQQHHHHQHQETSWTTNNYGATNNAKLRQQQTTYAIPANGLQQHHHHQDLQHQPAAYEPNQANLGAGQLDYGQLQNTCNSGDGASSIDACIQQLMEQQQYQQQYALLVGNQKQLAAQHAEPDSCIYNNENHSNFGQQTAPMSLEMQQLSQQTKLTLNANNGTQSIIDSSSSSSGIDLATHLDCLSSAASSKPSSANHHQLPSSLLNSQLLNGANNPLFSSSPTTTTTTTTTATSH